MNGPVLLSKFGAAKGCSCYEIEHGRMPLSRFAQHWHEQQDAEQSEVAPPYKPYIRNHYRARREKEAAQILER